MKNEPSKFAQTITPFNVLQGVLLLLVSCVGAYAQGTNPDTDQDGMPDAWEQQYGFNINDPSDANADVDGDGFTNLQEYLAGTNPHNPASALRLLSAQVFPDNSFQISFASSPGVTYLILRTDELGAHTTWGCLDTLTGSGGLMTVTDANAMNMSSSRFYSIAVGNGIFSLNVAGFVKRLMHTGTNLVTNPLYTWSDNISDLFPNCPNRTLLKKWDGYSFEDYMYSAGMGQWFPSDTTLVRGEGAILVNPGAPFEVVFVGEVPEGSLINSLPAGMSLKSSMAPVEGLLDFPAVEGDEIRTWDPTNQTYTTHQFLGGAWDVPPNPVPGESFWLTTAVPRNWVQDFYVLRVGDSCPPYITQQPTNRTVYLGEDASFTTLASGVPPLGYQWLKNGTNLLDAGNVSGSTTSTLTITNAQISDAGAYSTVITNLSGSVPSAVAVLTVIPPAPVITSQPQSQTNLVGTTAAFSVVATGMEPLSYQWRKDGSNLVESARVSGVTSPNLSVSTTEFADAGSYSVLVTNDYGQIESDPASLIVQGLPPSIVVPPTNAIVLLGDSLVLSAVATGTEPLSYQWRKDGSNLVDDDRVSGAQALTLTISNCFLSDSGQYRLHVSSPYGATNSSPATVTVQAVPPDILQEPEDQGAHPGETVQFAALVEGSEPLSYQWSRDGTNLIDGGRVSESTGSVLTVTNVELSDSGLYQLHVVSPYGEAWSAPAELSVRAIRGGEIDFGFDAGSVSGAPVSAVVALPDGQILVGGNFSTINGVAQGALARLDPDGTVDTGFDVEVYGWVSSIAVQADGRYVIGGDFDMVNGEARRGVARLLPNGTLDASFQDPGILGPDDIFGYIVTAVVPHNDGVVVGGAFTNVGGLTRLGIARLRADGSVDPAFLDGESGIPDAPDWDGANWGSVESVFVQPDGKILVGGFFTMVNDVARGGVARLNPDGSLDESFLNGLAGATHPYASATAVYTLAVQADGKVVVGGTFIRMNGIYRESIARLNPDGSLDSSFLAQSDGYVHALCLQPDEKILLGGQFTEMNSMPRGGIARLNADGSLDTAFGNEMAGVSGVQYPTVETIAVQEDWTVVIGGSFTLVNGWPAQNLARLHGGEHLLPIRLGIEWSAGEPLLKLEGELGQPCVLEYSHSLSNAMTWHLLEEFTLTNVPHLYRDQGAGAGQQRFYRAHSDSRGP